MTDEKKDTREKWLAEVRMAYLEQLIPAPRDDAEEAYVLRTLEGQQETLEYEMSQLGEGLATQEMLKGIEVDIFEESMIRDQVVQMVVLGVMLAYRVNNR